MRTPLPAALALTVSLIASASAATVHVRISNVVPNGSSVFVSLCSGGLEPETCQHGAKLTASAPAVDVDFTDVPQGDYAAVAFQDLAGTGTLPRTKMGLPLAPYALSNNAGRSRRPTFQQAAFSVREPGVVIALRLVVIAPK